MNTKKITSKQDPDQIKDHQLLLYKAVIAVNFPLRMGVISFQHPGYS